MGVESFRPSRYVPYRRKLKNSSTSSQEQLGRLRLRTNSFKKSRKQRLLDMVRTVVQLNKRLQEAVNREEPGWRNTDSMVIVKHANQSRYENPSLIFSATQFPYRSTLVKEERGWRAVEVARKYSERTSPFEEFEEGEKEVVTAISAKPIPLWILGTPYDAGEGADQESRGRDYWKVNLEKGEVVRHHVVPRPGNCLVRPHRCLQLSCAHW